MMISSKGFDTAQNSARWSTLSKTEQEQGVHPAKLGALRFDIDESELSGELRQKLQRFFVGCRLATTDFDFRSKLMLILNSNDQLLQPIRAIVERVMLAQMPEENLLQYDSPFRFDGERCEYKNKFVAVYNQLVEEKMCYLMHPARRSELVEYLGTAFPDAELAADRLIRCRCFGSYALNVSELERSLQKYVGELEQVERKLSSLFENGPNFINNPMELQEEALGYIPDKLCREYVCLAYKELASEGKLDCLDLSEEELHKFDGGVDNELNFIWTGHPNLAHFAKDYYEDASIGSYQFGEVVKYLKELRNGDLNDLMQLSLNEEKERLNLLIKFKKEDLQRANAIYERQINLSGKKSEDYKPGDFSFLTDPILANMLTKAYNVVDGLNEWPFFDLEPPAKKGYMCWDHPTVTTLGLKLGFDLGYLGLILIWMRDIHQKGWNVVVRESLENKVQIAGALNRAWATI